VFDIYDEIESSSPASSWDSSESLFEDRPFRKRQYRYSESPRPRKLIKAHYFDTPPSSAEASLDLFDTTPVNDFFGFSHTHERHESFSDFSHRKLFSEDFIK
jgi:hypothetical protein